MKVIDCLMISGMPMLRGVDAAQSILHSANIELSVVRINGIAGAII